MSLVPYTITALQLNQADATATGKQVVEGASCSMFIQPADTVVLLYDDAAASNGSTAKATGVNGQVTVYIQPGSYRVVANSISRFVQVGQDDAITTIGLISSTGIYPASTVINTTGFTTSGDAGDATWKQNGVTGQTVSQSPAQLIDGLLNDGLGNQWALVSTNKAGCFGILVGLADSGPAMRAAHFVARSIEYEAGQYNVTGGVTIPFGTTIKTAGFATEFFFSGMTDSTDCFEVVRNSPLLRMQNINIEPHKIALVDTNARYGWSTPFISDVFNREKPFINIECQTISNNRANAVTPFSFTSTFNIGDCQGGKLTLGGYGGYNAAIADAGQRPSDAITLGGATGNIGLIMKIQYLSCRKGLNLLDGVEGFEISGEVVSCAVGVDSSEQTVIEPGGFIDNMHVNARDCGYRLINRAEISIGSASAYKADGLYNDGASEWIGIDVGDQSSVRVGEFINNVGSTHTPVSRNTGIRFGANSYNSHVGHMESRNVGVLCEIGAVDGLNVSSMTSTNGVIGYNITGVPRAVTLGAITEGVTPLITDFLVMSASVPRAEIKYNQNSLEVTSFKTTTLSIAGSVELNPINTPMEQNFVVTSGVGVYTYDIILDNETAAVLGTKFILKINMPSNTNPTIRVLNKSNLAVLDSFNVSSSIRLIAEYYYTATGTFQTKSIYESLETSY